MTGRLIVRPAARNDLVGIGRYIARDSPAAADRFVDRLAEKSRLLAEQPGIGRPHPTRAGLRVFGIGEYLILYRETPDGIEVLRYLHGRRDLARIV